MGGKVSSGTGSSIASGLTPSDPQNAGVTTDTVAGLLRSASQGASSIGQVISVAGANGSTRELIVDRGRTRSLSGMSGNNNGTSMSIPALLSRSNAGIGQPLSTLMGSDTPGSTPDDFDIHGPLSSLGFGRIMVTYSLPPHMRPINGFKCPVCSKLVPYDEMECHLVMCLTKPRIVYNEDILSEDKGECVICLEDLCQGNTIARLPCLCIYHKSCIDKWFQVNRICPEHPYD